MNYKIIITESYSKKVKKFLKKHPNMIERYMKTIKILETNPYHPSLRLHKLQGKLYSYHSVSINMEYRILIDFIIKNNEIIPIEIGTHNEVY